MGALPPAPVAFLGGSRKLAGHLFVFASALTFAFSFAAPYALCAVRCLSLSLTLSFPSPQYLL